MFGNSSSVFVVDLVEVGEHALLDVASGLTKEATDVGNDIFAVLVREDLSEKSAGLLIVVVGVLVGVSATFSLELDLSLSVRLVLNGAVG